MVVNRNSVASEGRVLVCSTLPRDAEIAAKVLGEAGIAATPCRTTGELADAVLVDGVDAALVDVEMLSRGASRLEKVLESQPSWSDIPFVVLTGRGIAQDIDGIDIRLYEGLRNVTILERPVRILTLVTTLKSALAARARQYQVRDLLQDLERSKHLAESANRAKSAFLANMSHEIRTPLGVILGFSEFLGGTDLATDERRLYVETIRRNGRSLVSLIDELLDLSKIEAGRLDVELLTVCLPDVLSDVETTFDATARAKGIAFEVTAEGRIPTTIQTDPTRLRQILVNIVGNSIKFTSTGKVELRVAVRHMADSRPRLAFTVNDTGRGISAEERERLFQPFSQADPSMTRKYGGTGLGLVLARRLCRALGGDLQLAESAPDRGSTFIATIDPGTMQEALPQLEPASKTVAVAAGSLAGVSVLVADDAPDNQLLVSRMLTRNGIRVDVAENGAEAVTKALRSSYDVILMDVQMPVLDGYDATIELRRRGYLGPILALSAHAMREEKERSLSVGCDDHLTKPINKEHLLHVIARFAGTRRHRGGEDGRSGTLS